MRTHGRRRAAVMALGVAACLAAGCAVQRLSVVDLAGDATDDAGESDGGGEASPIDAAPQAEGAPAPPQCTPDAATCTSDNASCPIGSTYDLYDNQWNCSSNPCGPESAYGCDDGDGTVSFAVTSNQPAGNTTPLTYASMQANFHEAALSSFTAVSATFAETSPHAGTYEVAFEAWFDNFSVLLEIWVDDFGRTPPGSQVGTRTFGGRAYAAWRTSDGLQVTLVPAQAFTSGTVDLLEVFSLALAGGWIPSGATLSQVEFGVEIASTGGTSATFQFDEYSLTAN